MTEEKKTYVETAKRKYAESMRDGDMRFEDEPCVVESEHGAYVAAYVWVWRREAEKPDLTGGKENEHD
jgi:hypothetical protein